MFNPVSGQRPTRQRRKQWLIKSLLAALPPEEVEARKMVQDVTAHAFRAGLAGNLLAEEVP